MQVSELARTHNSFGHFVAEQVRNPASESQQCVGIHVDADFSEIGRKAYIPAGQVFGRVSNASE
jgi:hypothetical protein